MEIDKLLVRAHRQSSFSWREATRPSLRSQSPCPHLPWCTQAHFPLSRPAWCFPIRSECEEAYRWFFRLEHRFIQVCMAILVFNKPIVYSLDNYLIQISAISRQHYLSGGRKELPHCQRRCTQCWSPWFWSYMCFYRAIEHAIRWEFEKLRLRRPRRWGWRCAFHFVNVNLVCLNLSENWVSQF